MRLDAVVQREPGVYMPHYGSPLVRSPDATGLSLLRDLEVICELKVSATQGEGLDHREVAQDVWKLAMLLDEYEAAFPGAPSPLAYALVLDNHPRKSYDQAALNRHLDSIRPRPEVQVLIHTAAAAARPSFPDDSAWRIPRHSTIREHDPSRWDG
ncbi:hypothetical protein EXU48_20720 [Occultella glacieicola]|uniref:Uncharacterized protein n=1 Tax=Occultella glacieicola TaxID=2518684 RepID=A0ABY2DYM2_9MICO|nr:hypothetical protein EXU48_20720 [Occultella glacieicola]